MKKIILIGLFIFITNSVFSQKVKLKTDKIVIDGKEVFGYKSERINGSPTLTIYDLNTKEELIFIKEDDAGTYGAERREDDFTVYKFLKEGIKVEISYYTFMSNNVKFLFKNEIFDMNGVLNEKKITALKDKYDENISEKTILIR